MAVATTAGFLDIVGLLLADIAYAIADPRISFERME
jgi:ABC-type dipeptide/oligopeptide/nickel transport system permease component